MLLLLFIYKARKIKADLLDSERKIKEARQKLQPVQLQFKNQIIDGLKVCLYFDNYNKYTVV